MHLFYRQNTSPTVVLSIQIALLVWCGCNKSEENRPRPLQRPSITTELVTRFDAFEKVSDIPIPTGAASSVLAIAPDGTEYLIGGGDGSLQIVPLQAGNAELLIEHKEAVLAGLYSADGRTVITTGADNRLVIWDRVSRTVRSSQRAHNGNIKSVAITKDGTLAATGSFADDVCVWRVGTGEKLHCLEGHSADVTAVTFSLNGQHIFSGARDSQLRRWSVEHGRMSAPPLIFRSTIMSLAWSNDHRRLYVGTLMGELVEVDPDEHKTLHTRRVTRARLHAMAVSRTGLIAVGDQAGFISLWTADAEEDEPILGPLEGHAGGVRAMQFLPNSDVLVTLGADGLLAFWNSLTGEPAQPEQRIPPINGEVGAVAMQREGTLGAIASRDRLFLLDARQPTTLQSPNHLGPGGVSALSFSADGRQLYVGRHNGELLRLESGMAGRTLGSHSIHRGTIRHVIPSSDGTLIWTTGDDITIHGLDTQTYEPIHSWTDHTSIIRAFAVDPSGKRIASTEEDNITLVRNVETKAVEWTRRGHAITQLAFSPEGSQIAMVENRRIILIYDVAERIEIQRLSGNAATIRAIAFHPDGGALFTLDEHGTLRAWSAERGTRLVSADAGRGKPTSLSIGQNGQLVLTGGMDPRGSAKLFRLPLSPTRSGGARRAQ